MWRITSIILLVFCCGQLLGQSGGAWLAIPQLESSNTSDYDVQIRIGENRYMDSIPFTMNRQCNPCRLILSFKENEYSDQSYAAYKVSGIQSIKQTGDESVYSRVISNKTKGVFYIEIEGKRNQTIELDVVADIGDVFVMECIDFSEVYIELGKTSKLSLSFMTYLDRLMVGFLLMFLLLNLVSFRITESGDYFYYSCYILTLCIYYAVRQEYVFLNDLFNLFQEQHFISSLYISRVLTPVIFLFYFLFINSFFSTFDDTQFLKKSTKITTILSIVSPIVIYMCYLFGLDSAGTLVFTIYRVSMSLLSLVFIWYMFRRKTFSSTNFIIAGGLSLFVGSLMAMIFSWTNYWLFGIAPIYWLLISVLLEILFFSSGLLYKANQTEQYKNNIQESLLVEMKKNRDLQIQKEIILKKEIDKVKYQIEEEINEKLNVKYELESKDLELKLLRSQMNPHFLFNSMNSLKRYILENEVDNAADYLDSFARLFRYIFDNMQRKFVHLEDELEFLKEYVRLENLRFQNNINFEISCHEDLNPNHIMIPSLIMQPLVENSIWHGLSESESTDKSIKLNIYQNQEHLIIEVFDNGVGYSYDTGDQTVVKRRINSTSVNKQRLAALYGADAELKVSSEVVGGTLISISIPLN